MLEAPSGGSGLLALIVVAVIVVVAVIGAGMLSSDATERTATTSAAQQAAERERTERAALAEQTARHAAELRAEQAANLLPVIYIGGIGIVGLLVLVIALHSLSWAEGKQTQRTLLLIEAQRQARYEQLAAPREDALLFAPVRQTRRVYTNEEVEA